MFMRMTHGIIFKPSSSCYVFGFEPTIWTGRKELNFSHLNIHCCSSDVYVHAEIDGVGGLSVI